MVILNTVILESKTKSGQFQILNSSFHIADQGVPLGGISTFDVDESAA